MPDKPIKIPIKALKKCFDMPKYAYPGDAGFDLLSADNYQIEPQERMLIKCGFSIAIPNGYAGLILPRSGLAYKNGITVLNSPGLIDSGYRGEICVLLLNTDKTNTFKIEPGDRIAQMMIVPFANAELFEVNDLDESLRQSKGFGSSGIKS